MVKVGLIIREMARDVKLLGAGGRTSRPKSRPTIMQTIRAAGTKTFSLFTITFYLPKIDPFILVKSEEVIVNK